MAIYQSIKSRSTKTGVVLMAGGVVLLLALRFLANPLARGITGREPAGLLAFLGIPVFLALIALGMALFFMGTGPRLINLSPATVGAPARSLSLSLPLHRLF